MTQKRIEAFLIIADQELAAADKLRAPLPRQAQYFLQQSAEKLLRAVLESLGIIAGTSHQLFSLAEMLPPAHPLRMRFQGFEYLSNASTRYRYPSPAGVVHSVSSDDVGRTFTEVSRLREEVHAHLKTAQQQK